MLTVLQEKRLPGEAPEKGKQGFVIAEDDRAALIEDRQQVAQRATRSFRLAWQLPRVQRVDARLGEREGEPGEGVEPVMQAVGPGGDAAGLEDADFVLGILGAGRNEAHRLATFGAHAARFGESVEALQRPAAFEPRPHRVENGMR
jgi:hypothetical protein